MNKNSDLLQSLKSIECRDATYESKDPALVFDRAKGSFIFDAQGNKYLDLCAGFGALPFGHNPDFVMDLFREISSSTNPQICHGMGDVYPSTSKIKLLEKLKNFLPSYLSKGALTISGGQAVEFALKTAMLATGKSGVICFEGSYHGLDLGVLPTTSREDFREPFKPWLHEELISRLPFGCDELTFKSGVDELKEVACVIVEPVQGRAGVRFPPKEWLHELASWCRREKILLIFDEIWVGFGRTGRRFFAEEFECDIICLGKALGGGFPVSACFARPEVMDAWPESKGEALHTGTFFGHPLSCEVAYRNLCAFDEKDLTKTSKESGTWFLEKLKSEFTNYPQIEDIRGEGLMVAIEFKQELLAVKMMDLLRQKQIIALPSGEGGRVLSFTPALNIRKENLQQTISVLKQLI